MNWTYLFHPLDYVRMRSRRRQALRLLVYSGCVRSASQGIRYGMNEQELDEFLYRQGGRPHETPPTES